ncbi:uncharacterized protein LOC117300072 [Asterias rubens]|uniref:uncharacterized protein LOC117300072 n=1 Tax=Asterias rubens TaxID=7604 RepID=UPI001455A820|nr:uncharacterized protein LOC117300072 [Asterias rubens]XP_033639642.1 uncharacterized protein LOC117300072 [Asterias rubens]
MARSVSWRRTVSDNLSWRQDQAQSATIYILRETGPTGFLLKEEGETKKFKVFLGDPHSCTCPVFKKERDLCKHICWVLLKKFRVPRQNPITYQLGLVEREINEILRGIKQRSRQSSQVPDHRSTQNHKPSASASSSSNQSDGREVLAQREITEDDVCPICQDELLNAREPVTYCRYGCAKSIHIKCMKVWAEHQKSTGETLICCPLCREDFGQMQQLQAEYRTASLQKTRSERLDVHGGVCCQHCNKSPIQGKCYRCTDCFDFCLCHACFIINIHTQHSFKFRQKINQRWRPAQRGSGTALPQAVMDDLLARDISDNDYDLLLQLDSQTANQPSNIPEKVIKSFPTETVRQGSALLNPGMQCRICLRGYSISQVLRRLPCKHKFHASCIDPWLLHQHPTCPVDGSIVWTPNQETTSTSQSQRVKESPNGVAASEIPGIGVTAVRLGRSGDAGSRGRLRGRLGVVERAPNEDVEGLASTFALTGLGITSRKQPQSASSSSGERQRRPSLSRRFSNQGQSVNSGGIDNGAGLTLDFDAISATAIANTEWEPQHLHLHGQSGGTAYLRTHQQHASSSLQQDEDISELSGSFEDKTSHVPMRLEKLTLPEAVEAQGRQPLPRATSHRKPPLPSQPLVDRSSAPSIPLLRESVMTPIGNSRQQSSSAPSLGNRTVSLEIEGVPSSSSGRPPLPTGGSPGSMRDRGRQSHVRSSPSTRRARSTSIERSSSRDRLNPPNNDKQQFLEGLFLGSAPISEQGQSMSTSGIRQVKGQRTSQLRSRVNQGHNGVQAERDKQLDAGVSGNAIGSQSQW